MALLGQIIGMKIGVGPPNRFKVVCSKESEDYLSWAM
jgi:hypothetical protein